MTYETATNVKQRSSNWGRHPPINWQKINSVFNRTMSFRRDSDVVVRHGYVEKRQVPLTDAAVKEVYSQEPRPDFSQYTYQVLIGYLPSTYQVLSRYLSSTYQVLMRYSLSILTRLLPKERLVKLPLHGLSHTAKRILAGTNTLVGSPSGSEWISTAGDQNINLRHFIKQDTVVDTFNIQYKTLPNVYCQRCGNLTCGEVKNIKQEYSTDQVIPCSQRWLIIQLVN